VVAIEWIGGSEQGTVLSLPITFPSFGAVHFYKFGSQNNWKIFSNMSSCIMIQIAE